MFDILIEEAFWPHVESAVARLSYLFPTWGINCRDGMMSIDCDSKDEAAARKEIAYALYREKIYAESLPMRSRMVARLLG